MSAALAAPMLAGGDQLAAGGCAIGPHFTARYTYTEPPNECQFSSATIYYPVTQGDTPAVAAGAMLPSVVIVPGYLCSEQTMAAWAPFYASHGIVTMLVAPKSPLAMPRTRCMVLLAGVRALKAENTRDDSPLRGCIDETRFAVQGWSLGGGGAQLAAMEDPSLKCAIALSPHHGPPCSYMASRYDQFTDIVPVCFLVGAWDPIAPPWQFSRRMYRSTRSPKLLLEVSRGDHAVANGPAGGNVFDVAGALWCFACCQSTCAVCCPPCAQYCQFRGESGHAREDARRGAIGGVALAWLKVHLVGDDSYIEQLTSAPSIAKRFETVQVMERA